MATEERWLLPDGMEEILPPEARHLELIRRQLLDHFASWGYEYVIPPMVEFLESLLTGTGRDLNHKTFKITDQISGRLMGIRADMTPQVARIDAHSLGKEGPVRLCYAGTLLQAHADNAVSTRAPIRVGAELFGIEGLLGEYEIICMMIDSLLSAGIKHLRLELGDVGIFRTLAKAAELTADQETTLFEQIQRKAAADLGQSIGKFKIRKPLTILIEKLPSLMGTEDVLKEARNLFSGNAELEQRVELIEQLYQQIVNRYPEVDIFFDLSELRGYTYHTGIVFSAYDVDTGKLLSRGGRYDHIGEVFGRSRVATGFDVDLKVLANLPVEKSASPLVVIRQLSPGSRKQKEAADDLRKQGYIVIEGEAGDIPVEYELVNENEAWVLKKYKG